jgi:ubiquinone/menaquinone biosynthesis C-methylase UbiE
MEIYSKAMIAGAFGRAAVTYDRVGPNFFGPWAEKLVDMVGLATGESVLDVAAGRGAVLLRAAEP